MSNASLSAEVQTYDIIVGIAGVLPIGFVATIGNIFILVVIWKNKNLQTPCYLLIAGGSFCSIFVAAGLFSNAAQDAAMLLNSFHVNQTRVHCYWSRAMIPVWGVQGSAVIACAISVDRLVGILFPTRYRQLGKRYAFSCLAFSYVYVTAAVMLGFVDTVDSQPYIMCYIFFNSFTVAYTNYFGMFNLIFSVTCVFLYATVLGTFEFRRRQGNNANTVLKQQMACMPTIKLLMTFYFITGVLPEITLAAASSSAVVMQYFARTFYYDSVLKVSMSLAEIAALSLGSQQFRNAAKSLFKKNPLKMANSSSMYP